MLAPATNTLLPLTTPPHPSASPSDRTVAYGDVQKMTGGPGSPSRSARSPPDRLAQLLHDSEPDPANPELSVLTVRP